MADISKFLARADDALKKRNFPYAIQMFFEALQVEPGHIEARRNLRLVLLKAADEGAKVEAPPSKTIIMSRDPKVIVAENEKNVIKNPRSDKYNMRVAEGLAQMGHHEAAGNVYEYVVNYCEKGKENIEAMKAGVRAYIDSGKADAANKLLNTARRLAPQDKDLAELSRNTAATSTLSRITAKGSSSYDMLKNTGETAELALLSKKVLSKPELDQALQIIDRKLQATPTDKTLIKKKAELYGKAKQYDAAYKWLMAKYSDLDNAPDIAELAVKYKNFDFEYKLKFCEHKISEEPAKADEWRAKAKQVEASRRQFQLGEYQRQVDEAPADLDRRYLLGKSLVEAGKAETAVPHLQKAAKSPKIAKHVGILLGCCYISMNRLELALQQLQNVAPSITDVEEDLRAEVRYWMADVFERMGTVDEAKKLFQELYLENAAYRDVGERLDRLRASS